jgi:hypothetical protein
MKKLILAFLLLSSPVFAQQTPAQTYLAYRAAFEHATSLEAVRPYLAGPVLVKVDAVPTAEKPKVFGLLKTMSTAYQVRVIAETATPDGYALIVDGVDGADKPLRGTVEMVKEANTWKLVTETWHSR